MSEQITDVDFYKVDVDEAQDISQQVSVRAVSPPLSLFMLYGKLTLISPK
jgi:hypothetical protein